ncbi:MAG TPA: AMP-binding protein, partial [bacterium]|nr:AMP-binding protein [bacterium]
GSRLRYCASGGAKLDPAITERLLDLGILMLEGYGLTETAPVISFTPISKPKPGSVGLPLEGIEVRIDKPDTSGQGEICMRGPNLMKGYYQKEAATAEVIRDGWFHTGDLGFLDKDGMITITGRAKEIIILPSGKNIYPEEVEARYESPLIKEICVAPINDAEGVCQGLRAIVVPNVEELAARKAANIYERIRSALTIIGASLPSYMRVTELVLFDEPLPRTRLGKLRRSNIDQMVRQKETAPTKTESVEISAEVQAVLNDPITKRFVKRLSELTDKKEVILPSHDLELDLGLDSLTQVQLTMIVEEEFGVAIPDEDFANIRTVGDILHRIRHGANEPVTAETTVSWSERLQQQPEVSLESLFTVNRGWIKRILIALLRILVRLLMRFYFRARIEGLEYIPKDGALLICPNHQSYIDPVLVFSMLPERIMRRAFFVGFEDIFSRPPLSWATKIGRIILTGGASTWAESLKLSADVLRRKMVI